jgi:hypothetical protein
VVNPYEGPGIPAADRCDPSNSIHASVMQ